MRDCYFMCWALTRSHYLGRLWTMESIRPTFQDIVFARGDLRHICQLSQDLVSESECRT